MKMIIQIFDMAGVASLHSQILNDSGIPSLTLYRPKDDPYQISEYYRSEIISNNPVKMLLELIVILFRLRPKVLVIHYHQIMVPILRIICLLIGLRCQVVMFYHGSNSRINSLKPYIPYFAHHLAGVTQDICTGQMTLLENPVDQELFYPDHSVKNCKKAVFHRSKPLDCTELAHWYAKILGLQLECLAYCPHEFMGDLLREYAFYFDMKGLDVLSKTALEALQCGAVVLNEKGKWTYPLDVNNQLKIERIVSYYAQIQDW